MFLSVQKLYDIYGSRLLKINATWLQITLHLYDNRTNTFKICIKIENSGLHNRLLFLNRLNSKILPDARLKFHCRIISSALTLNNTRPFSIKIFKV